MKVTVRSLAALLGSIAAFGACTAHAAIDKAVYYDTTVGFSWQNADAAKVVNDYLVGKGYTTVDATALADWMNKHITAGDTSVVVFDTDQMPDTVMDPDANTDPDKAKNSIFNKYMQAGGKVVYLADWPAYYLRSVDGTSTTWNDTGSATALGFTASVWGYTDYGVATQFTDEGKKWGLTKPWNSLRATPTSAIGLVLGNPAGHPEAAMPWVKMYIGRPGSGFTYLYDHPTTATEFTDEDLKQIQSVAEYFPKGEVTPDGTINVTLKESDGTPGKAQVVRLDGDSISLTATTDDNGKVSFKTIAGSYSAKLAGAVAADPTFATVTLTAGGTQEVTLQKPVTQDVSSAGGTKWEIKLPATQQDDTGAYPKPTDDPASIPTAPGFQEITVPCETCWDDLLADDNVYGWYRASITLQDALVGKDVVFGGWNLDDEDWTYWNGTLIGHTNSYNTVRQYVVPANLVKKTNTVVILGRDGTGGGGLSILTDVPKVYAIRASGSISGQVKDQSGASASFITVTATGNGEFGNQSVTATVDATGNFTIKGLGAGTYAVSTSGGVRGTTHGAAQNVTVTAGNTATASLTVTSPTIPTLTAPTDKAVFYDTASTFGWVNAASAAKIDDYFKGKGYTEVNSASLKTFMQSHITSKTPSVVVMANDIFPDTVVDVSSGAVVATGNVLADYLNAGGRVVFSGDIPVYNVSQSGTNITPGDAGATTVLGFNTSPGGRDVGDAPVLTAQGTAMGLTGTWQRSLRPALTSDVDVVLASAQNSTRAAGWIRFYGTGAFIRWIDATEDDATYLIDGILPDIQKLAEFSGNLGGTTPTPVKGDINGDGKVNIGDATLALQISVGNVTPTAAQIAAGDVISTGDGIKIGDVIKILQVAVGNGSF